MELFPHAVYLLIGLVVLIVSAFMITGLVELFTHFGLFEISGWLLAIIVLLASSWAIGYFIVEGF
jgi:hypothetical protein